VARQAFRDRAKHSPVDANPRHRLVDIGIVT
jgi:hypothetical protein